MLMRPIYGIGKRHIMCPRYETNGLATCHDIRQGCRKDQVEMHGHDIVNETDINAGQSGS